MSFRQVTQRTIEHVALTSDGPYKQVQAAIEAQMRILWNTDEVVRQFMAAMLSWDQVREAIERRRGRADSLYSARSSRGNCWRLQGSQYLYPLDKQKVEEESLGLTLDV